MKISSLLILLFVLFSFITGYVSAQDRIETNSYDIYSIESFISSPDADEAVDDYCEYIYLKANRRRDFTSVELEQCGDIFAQKNEAEMNYMNYVLSKRGVE